MSLQASCTNCDFARRFSPELAGRFYRCPRCREGVVAVPAADDGDATGSASSPGLALSSSSFEFPLALEEARKKKAQHKETEEVTALDATALDGSVVEPEGAAEPDPPAPEAGSGLPLSSSALESIDLAGEVLQGDDPSNHRGQVAEARRILVECGLCSFHVRIPVEFFGKTVHCPECAGNTMFTESTLEPVKDELLDRLALETTERNALYLGKERRRWPAWLRNQAVRSFLLGVGLGLLVLAIVFGVLRGR